MSSQTRLTRSKVAPKEDKEDADYTVDATQIWARDLTVPELKAELKGQCCLSRVECNRFSLRFLQISEPGLDCKGNKAVLVERLQQVFDSERQAQEKEHAADN